MQHEVKMESSTTDDDSSAKTTKGTAIRPGTGELAGWRKAFSWMFCFFHRSHRRPVVKRSPVRVVGNGTGNNKNKTTGSTVEGSRQANKEERISKREIKKMMRATEQYRIERHALDWVPVPPRFMPEAKYYFMAMATPDEQRTNSQWHTIDQFEELILKSDAIWKGEVVTVTESHLRVESVAPPPRSFEGRELRVEALNNLEAQKYCRRKSWGVANPPSHAVGRQKGRWF